MTNLICQVELFSLDQEVVFMENGTIKGQATVKLADLPSTITSYGLDPSIEKISLFGPTAYVEELGESLMQNLTTEFNNRNLKIEVNGKCLNT